MLKIIKRAIYKHLWKLSTQILVFQLREKLLRPCMISAYNKKENNSCKNFSQGLRKEVIRAQISLRPLILSLKHSEFKH